MKSELPLFDIRRVDNELTITLLTGFSLTLSTHELPINARKDRALCAYLANTPGKPYRRNQLAALLWSDSEDSRARDSLKKALLRLRKILPDGLLITDRVTACLSLDRNQVDVSCHEDLLNSGDVDSVLQAAGMFNGNFLQEFEGITAEFEDWRGERQLQLLEMIRKVMLSTMTQTLALGNLVQTEALANHMTVLDPLDEQAARVLITAYLSDGRTGQARRIFTELEDRLRDQLGVDPEQATVSLISSLDFSATTNYQIELTAIPRIAVLAFDVGAGEANQAYFAQGLTDDITTDLARTRNLEVLPSSTFSDLHGDVTRVLLARGVTHVLHGSVRRSHGRLRVNTRLLDTRNNQILWAQRYDCTPDDVFDMQDAVSAQVVLHLHRELSPDSAPGHHHGTRNAHAYEMFHKGRSLYLRGMNNHSLRGSKALLQLAIDIDPGFARAHAQLAICESCLAMSLVNKTGEEITEQGMRHSITALALMPNLALGHAAQGLSFYATGHYAEAEHSLQRAISLDENLFEAQFFLARNRHLQGDRKGAVRSFRIAAALRPDDFRSSGLLGEELKSIGRATDAVVAFNAAIDRVEAELERHPDNAGALAFGAPILCELQRLDQAQQWSTWALAIEPDDCLLRYNLARMHTMLNNHAEALEHLARAFNVPALIQRRLALWMRHDEDFKPLAGDANFQKMLMLADR